MLKCAGPEQLLRLATPQFSPPPRKCRRSCRPSATARNHGGGGTSSLGYAGCALLEVASPLADAMPASVSRRRLTELWSRGCRVWRHPPCATCPVYSRCLSRQRNIARSPAQAEVRRRGTSHQGRRIAARDGNQCRPLRVADELQQLAKLGPGNDALAASKETCDALLRKRDGLGGGDMLEQVDVEVREARFAANERRGVLQGCRPRWSPTPRRPTNSVGGCPLQVLRQRCRPRRRRQPRI